MSESVASNNEIMCTTNSVLHLYSTRRDHILIAATPARTGIELGMLKLAGQGSPRVVSVIPRPILARLSIRCNLGMPAPALQRVRIVVVIAQNRFLEPGTDHAKTKAWLWRNVENDALPAIAQTWW